MTKRKQKIGQKKKATGAAQLAKSKRIVKNNKKQLLI